MEATSRTSTLAIVSLIFGILGWTALPVIGSLIAILTGHMARKEIRESYGSIQGDGLAVAGLVLGWVAILLGLVSLILLALLFVGFPLLVLMLIFGFFCWLAFSILLFA